MSISDIFQASNFANKKMKPVILATVFYGKKEGRLKERPGTNELCFRFETAVYVKKTYKK